MQGFVWGFVQGTCVGFCVGIFVWGMRVGPCAGNACGALCREFIVGKVLDLQKFAIVFLWLPLIAISNHILSG